jgi:hypothetical protein
MGMYDYVEIECELPIPDYIPQSIVSIIKRSFEENVFQTKELNCTLDNYRVSKNNRLYLTPGSWFGKEPVGPEELIDYHGIIEADMIVYLDDSNLLDTGEYLGVGANGYLSRINGPNVKRNWIYITYRLKFTDGYLVDISMISPTENELLKLI